MFILMPVIFVLGILAIALEDKIKINKAAIALFMAISLWMILMFDAYDILVSGLLPDISVPPIKENYCGI